MPDIATVSDSRELDACHAGIRSSEGGIEIITLGDDRQDSASGCGETSVWLLRRACVEQLVVIVALMGGLDGITLARCVGIALCCRDDTGAATR